MSRHPWRVCAAAAALLVVGCSNDPVSDTPAPILTDGELQAIRGFSPLPAVPADPSNRYADNAAAARLGQRFFFDKGYSGALVVGDDGANGGLGAVGESGKIACASCHLAPNFIDTRSKPNNVALGANWGRRNVTSIVNAAYYQWFNTDGGNDVMWAGVTTTEGAGSHNSSRSRIAHHVFEKYRAEYEAVFGPLDPALDPRHPQAARFPATARTNEAAWMAMAAADQNAVNTIFANFGKAMGAYMRLLVSRDAPFDRFVAGDRSALGADAQRGVKLFLGKGGCAGCHSGAFFSDNAFHNLGVPQVGPHLAADEGRLPTIARLQASTNLFTSAGAFSDVRSSTRLDALQAADGLRGAFRTATLRNVALTAPYMHTGMFATLEDVIDFYDKGGGTSDFVGTKSPAMRPLGLTAGEKADLVAFLRSLTGQPVPNQLTLDTSAR
jgi:cytochrome c peroxidase